MKIYSHRTYGDSKDILGKTISDRINEDSFMPGILSPDTPKEYIELDLLINSQLKDMLNTYFKSVIPLRRWVYLLSAISILLMATLLLVTLLPMR